MIERHVVYYMGSKVFAAALNLASVAIFARLAGPAGYGEYLIAFAWAYIVYGFSIQWVRFAFFAGYNAEQASDQIATFSCAVWGALAIVAAAGVVTGVTGLMPASTLVSVIALVVALSLYDGAHEIARSRLRAEAVATAVVLRAVLTLAFGIFALKTFGTAVSLALAVTAAHLGAVLPLVPDMAPHLRSRWSREAAMGFFQFGWPLIMAFGISSLGQNVDRLLLARLSGLHVVGPYGAVNDLIKQSMVVVSEAIAGAYIAIAKRAAAQGNDARATEVLEHAFRAYTAVAAFGAAFIMRFERPVIDLLLGQSFREPTENLVPIFVLATIISVYRSFYFGQVIFFVQSSRLELAASAAMVSVVALLSALLVPTRMAEGAALALLGGQLAAGLVYVTGGRKFYAMPVPWRDFLGIVLHASAGFAVTALVDRTGLPPAATMPLDVLVLLTAFAAAARRYDLLSLNQLASTFKAKAGAALRAQLRH